MEPIKEEMRYRYLQENKKSLQQIILTITSSLSEYLFLFVVLLLVSIPICWYSISFISIVSSIKNQNIPGLTALHQVSFLCVFPYHI